MTQGQDAVLQAGAALLGIDPQRLGAPLSGHSGSQLCWVSGEADQPDRVLKVSSGGQGESGFLHQVAPGLPVATPVVAAAGSHGSLEALLLEPVQMLEPAHTWSAQTWQRVVADLARLHQTPEQAWANTEWTPRPAAPLWTPTAEQLGARQELWHAIADAQGELSREQIDALLGELAQLRDAAAGLPPVLIHGDAHRGNLGQATQVDSSGQDWLPCWIDWQEAQLGTGAEDLSLLFQRAEHDGAQVPRQALIEQYAQARGLSLVELEPALVAQEIQLLLLGWPEFILGHPSDPAVQRLAGRLVALGERWHQLAAASPGQPGGSVERPAVYFADAGQFEAWLERHHDRADEVWVELRGAKHPDRGMTWDDGVLVGLCFGWIDSLSQPVAEGVRRQRWTPRRPGSNWSQVNLAHVERLTAEGRMRPSGLAAHQARTSSNPTYSYESDPELDSATAAVLASDPIAQAFFDQARPWYRTKAIHWVMSAKQPQTRLRRAEQLRQASVQGELVRPLAPEVTPRWVEQLHAAVLASRQAGD